MKILYRYTQAYLHNNVIISSSYLSVEKLALPHATVTAAAAAAATLSSSTSGCFSRAPPGYTPALGPDLAHAFSLISRLRLQDNVLHKHKSFPFFVRAPPTSSRPPPLTPRRESHTATPRYVLRSNITRVI